MLTLIALFLASLIFLYYHTQKIRSYASSPDQASPTDEEGHELDQPGESWVFGKLTIENIINRKLLYFSMLLHWYEVEAIMFIVLLVYIPLSSGLFKLNRYIPRSISNFTEAKKIQVGSIKEGENDKKVYRKKVERKKTKMKEALKKYFYQEISDGDS
jgi:hypothetical protein